MKNETENKIRVFIADDHPIYRKGLREVIEDDAELVIVGEADDGEAAFEQIQSLAPEVAVLDIGMPKMNGFAVAEEVRALKIPAKIIFLTMYKERDAFNRALDLGVKGYLLKDSAANEIVGGIKAVAGGGHYISPAISSFLVNRLAQADLLVVAHPGLQTLTPTENRILRLIAEKKTSKEIADGLFVSPRTVDNHRANICQKLDLRGGNALLKFALEHKSELS
ncbi:MAG: response regulator transcription factor [Acidobacteria bacterium]|jgi:DNA-binding NarL/FixJ family response regulator|nr:response regulator transcription factor [Acidobacteriota bacterium]